MRVFVMAYTALAMLAVGFAGGLMLVAAAENGLYALLLEMR